MGIWHPDITQLTETREQRLVRLTGYNPCQCPKCKTGTMQAVEILPRIRSPDNVFYPRTETLNLLFIASQALYNEGTAIALSKLEQKPLFLLFS